MPHVWQPAFSVFIHRTTTALLADSRSLTVPGDFHARCAAAKV